MKYPHRFFLPALPAGAEARLDKEQSHHLIKVLRRKAGDRVELFDVGSRTALAEIISVEEPVRLKILSQIPKNRSEPHPEITLATAIPKGARMDWLVEKCAELGLHRLIPLETRYSVVKASGPAKTARWHKIAVEAAKQSRQFRILEISEILPFDRLFDKINEYDTKLLATPEGAPVNRMSCAGAQQILYLIGPEGGFSPEEVQQAQTAGFKAVQLPVDGILRVETAAVVMLGILKVYAHYKEA